MYNNRTTTNTTKVYKESKEHNDIYWFGMGGLYHPYVYTIRTSSCESATPILFTSIILSVDYKRYNSLYLYSPILMLTKKELLPRYSALGNHPKESRDSASPKGHQDHYQDFPPEVSNPN